MNILLDTNILVYLSKETNAHHMERTINPNNRSLYTSIASIGELRSIALQNRWGKTKWDTINRLLLDVSILEISDSLAFTYAQIDAFSQCRHPSYADYPFLSSRNMTKNDLWIAATAAFLGLKLVTTDADFDHLHERFFEVEHLSPSIFKSKK